MINFYTPVAASIHLSTIVPAKIQNDIARFITLQGDGFTNIISVQLSNNVIIQHADIFPINDNVIGVKIPEKISPGTYHLSIMDTKNIYEFPDSTFQVVTK
jgi:hypothetical protein